MATAIPDKRWVKKYPELGTAPLPAEGYLSQTQFDLERERIFRRCWLNVGHVSQVPNAGDFFVRRIEICRASILVIRGRDGVVRGMHNVCSHRGNALTYDEGGHCRGYMICNFHGWGYDTDGSLKHVPDESNFYDLDKSKHGLTPVATEVWNGFIFCSLAPRQPLTEYLGDVAVRLTGGDWDKYVLKRSYKIDERSNWKVSIDAQNDGYHVAWQHRHLMANRFTANEQGSGRLADLTFLGDHSLSAAGMGPGFRPTPLEAALWQIESGGRQVRLPLQNGFEFYLLFPNFVMIFFHGASHDACLTQNFWPMAVDHTIWEIRFYGPKPINASELIGQDFVEVYNRVVFDEDATAHEWVHAGLESRAKTQLVLQDEEITIRHFHKVVQDYLGNGAP
jgi:phenylpropionate dioxygenase-like ring-hydroxylating dioxygenase large terminal subunit